MSKQWSRWLLPLEQASPVKMPAGFCIECSLHGWMSSNSSQRMVSLSLDPFHSVPGSREHLGREQRGSRGGGWGSWLWSNSSHRIVSLSRSISLSTWICQGFNTGNVQDYFDYPPVQGTSHIHSHEFVLLYSIWFDHRCPDSLKPSSLLLVELRSR